MGRQTCGALPVPRRPLRVSPSPPLCDPPARLGGVTARCALAAPAAAFLGGRRSSSAHRCPQSPSQSCRCMASRDHFPPRSPTPTRCPLPLTQPVLPLHAIARKVDAQGRLGYLRGHLLLGQPHLPAAICAGRQGGGFTGWGRAGWDGNQWAGLARVPHRWAPQAVRRAASLAAAGEAVGTPCVPRVTTPAVPRAALRAPA